jgi:hypothetical protein
VKILFDHNVDRRYNRHLTGHQISTTRQMRWEHLDNGTLLRSCAAAGFEVFVSVDKNIRYQQNLDKLLLPIVVLDTASNALADLVPFAPHLLRLLSGRLDAIVHVLARDGTVAYFGASGRPNP